jgi:hypothetical protein
MTIQTVSGLRRLQRRVDRRRCAAARVISAMQSGEALKKHFTSQGPVYTLTNGKPVSHDVAAVVTADIQVIPVNDGLFPGTPQTWRWAE